MHLSIIPPQHSLPLVSPPEQRVGGVNQKNGGGGGGGGTAAREKRRQTPLLGLCAAIMTIRESLCRHCPAMHEVRGFFYTANTEITANVRRSPCCQPASSPFTVRRHVRLRSSRSKAQLLHYHLNGQSTCRGARVKTRRTRTKNIVENEAGRPLVMFQWTTRGLHRPNPRVTQSPSSAPPPDPIPVFVTLLHVPFIFLSSFHFTEWLIKYLYFIWRRQVTITPMSPPVSRVNELGAETRVRFSAAGHRLCFEDISRW